MNTVAKDIMTTELIYGTPDMTLEDAIKVLFNRKITGVPVVDQNGKMIGVLSEFDIIQSIDDSSKGKPLNLKQKIRFRAKVTTVDEDTPLDEILRLFVEKQVRRLPVLNGKRQLVGIISRRDIMRVLFYRSKTF